MIFDDILIWNFSKNNCVPKVSTTRYYKLLCNIIILLANVRFLVIHKYIFGILRCDTLTIYDANE